MLKPMTLAPDFDVIDMYDTPHKLSDYRGKKVMLSFYRYASCTFCNLRIAELIRAYPEFSKQNMEFLAVFQSSKDKVLEHAGALKPPFPNIPDPKRALYKLYGVQHSSRWKYFVGLLHFNKLITAFSKGLIKGKSDGDKFLIPADFLINENQIIDTAYYGKDISDHLPLVVIRNFINRGEG